MDHLLLLRFCFVFHRHFNRSISSNMKFSLFKARYQLFWELLVSPWVYLKTIVFIKNAPSLQALNSMNSIFLPGLVRLLTALFSFQSLGLYISYGKMTIIQSVIKLIFVVISVFRRAHLFIGCHYISGLFLHVL